MSEFDRLTEESTDDRTTEEVARSLAARQIRDRLDDVSDRATSIAFNVRRTDRDDPDITEIHELQAYLALLDEALDDVKPVVNDAKK